MAIGPTFYPNSRGGDLGDFRHRPHSFLAWGNRPYCPHGVGAYVGDMQTLVESVLVEKNYCFSQWC